MHIQHPTHSVTNHLTISLYELFTWFNIAKFYFSHQETGHMAFSMKWNLLVKWIVTLDAISSEVVLFCEVALSISSEVSSVSLPFTS